MTQEMTSFVLRFVREVSEEQGARWRGLIQHVQSGAERNFTTFADAVNFMQGRVLESTIQTVTKGEKMTEANPFADLASEMTKVWGEFGPQMVEMWTQATEQVMSQSMALRSQVDQAVASTLRAWGLSSAADQETILTQLDHLSDQVGRLTARVEALEKQLAKPQSPPKRRGGKGATTEDR